MLKDMKTRKHPKPGQMGTKRLVEQFGDALLCVRYRYDEKRGVHLNTAEIIVEEKPAGPVVHFRDDDLVKLTVAFTEKGLRDRLKAEGGRWDPQEKLWLVRYGAVRGTELEDRILADRREIGPAFKHYSRTPICKDYICNNQKKLENILAPS